MEILLEITDILMLPSLWISVSNKSYKWPE